jgi:TP901 family phage tail tape measure protein
MADIQSNIKVGIDTTDALASIKNLQRQISAFHTSMAKGGAAANAVTAQLQQNLINSVNATGKFSAQMKTIRTTTESFTNSLEKNKFSLGEYFRYAGGASKTFGKLFKAEFETINKVARENVKDLQTQYIKMGRDANGAMKAIAVRPLSLDMNDLATKTMIASERQALLNQLLKQGSTNLLNFGKNTQWAGRQLMVGFTIPLIAVGSQAAKTFMDMETQAIRFKKVYGDLFTPQAESQQALKDIQDLGKEFTKYGIAVSSTVGLAAEAAAAGFQGVDLQRQTAAATKLSILGQVESQKALETTISLQNAFAMSSENLAESIDFLNAVENQTVLSLDDVSTAIPKAAPIVQQLGGDVKDLAFFMTAMKEGGINASEGANALKSGLASLINPTGKAAAMLEGFGINAKKIVVDNKGDLKKTVIEFATALNQLDPLNRAQAIEQMFGKFQFSRLSTLFANVTKEGTQAARVLDLAGSSVQELADLSEKELGMTSESAMNKFKGAVENLKLALVPVGEEFLKAVTPIAEFVTKILDKFNNLGDGTKKIIVTLTAIVAGLGPVLLMTFGLLANGLANIIKGFTAMKTLFNRTGQSSATLGTEVRYMTQEQRNAAAVAASLDQVHRTLAQTFTAEATSVDRLTAAYGRSIAAQRAFMPTGAPMGRGPAKPAGKFSEGGIISGPGGPTSDSVPIMASDGEAIISARIVKKFPGMVNGLISGNIPGFKKPGIISKHTGRVAGGQISTPTHGGSGIMAPGNYAGKAADSDIAGMSSKFMGAVDEVTQEFVASDEFIASTNAALKTTLMHIDGVPRITGKAITSYEEAWVGIDEQLDEFARIFAKGMGPDVQDVSQLGQKQFPAMMRHIDTLEQSLQISAEQAFKLREATRKLYNPDLGTVSAPGRDAVTKNTQRVELGIDEQGNEVVTGVKVERTALPGRDKSGYLNKKTKNVTAREFRKRGLAEPDDSFTFAHIKSGEQAIDYVPPTTGGVPTAAEQKVLEKLRRGEKISQGAVVTSGNKVVVDQAKQDARVYTETVKKETEDVYPASRERKSPHPLAAKDGKDDANSYETAREKETKRRRRAASRAQGAPASVTTPGKRVRRSASSAGGTVGAGGKITTAPVFMSTPDDARMLPIVSKPGPMTRTQRLMAGAKRMPGRMSSLGGGMGLLGANMGLSMLPEFAGKGVAQGGLAGANLGMMFGPQGMAAGAAIGVVTSAFNTLIAKQKEHAAITKATFSVSTDLITAFGDKVLDTSARVLTLSKATKGVTDETGRLNAETQKYVDLINSMPKDSTTGMFVENLKGAESFKAMTGMLRENVATQIAIGGLSVENADNMVMAYLTSIGKANQFGSVWKSVSASLATTSEATATAFIKLEDSLGKTGMRISYFNEEVKSNKNAYKEFGSKIGNIADNFLSLFNIIGNGSLAFKDIQVRLAGLDKAGIKTTDIMGYLSIAISKNGTPEQIERFNSLQRVIAGLGGAAQFTASQIGSIYTMSMLGKDITATALSFASKTGLKQAGGQSYEDFSRVALKKYLESPDYKKLIDDQKKAQDAFNKANGLTTSPYKDPNTDTKGKGKTPAELYLEILQKQIDALEAKRDAQKELNAQIQREIELQEKMQDLESQAINAKITGNYIQAAALGQQSNNLQAQYNRDLALAKMDDPIDALKARKKAIEDGAKLTKSELSQIPKKANGGLIKGPGTGRSDSIRATLGYAGGGSIRVSNGEFVVKASSVRDYGVAAMNAVNNGTADISTNSGGTVYNINMPITSNNASPEGVANEVMRRLKVELNKNNKTNKVGI